MQARIVYCHSFTWTCKYVHARISLKQNTFRIDRASGQLMCYDERQKIIAWHQ